MAISAEELGHISRSLGDVAVTSTGRAGGRYVAPQVEVLMVEGTSPTFTAAESELARAGITDRTQRIDLVELERGGTLGPFNVVHWRQVEEPGGMIELGLEVIP